MSAPGPLSAAFAPSSLDVRARASEGRADGESQGFASALDAAARGPEPRAPLRSHDSASPTHGGSAPLNDSGPRPGSVSSARSSAPRGARGPVPDDAAGKLASPRAGARVAPEPADGPAEPEGRAGGARRPRGSRGRRAGPAGHDPIGARFALPMPSPTARPAGTGARPASAHTTGPHAPAAPVGARPAATLGTAVREHSGARTMRAGTRAEAEKRLPAARGAPEPTPTAAAAAGTPEPRPAPAVHAPAAVTGPAPLLPYDPAADRVSGAIGAHAAHLRVDAPQLGELALHLRVRDGVAHLRVEGDASALLTARAPELSRALAAEGLTLGHVEAIAPSPASATGPDAPRTDTRGGERRDHHRDAPDPEDLRPASRAAAAGRSDRPRSGHHVEA